MCTYLTDEDGVEGKVYDCGSCGCANSEKSGKHGLADANGNCARCGASR